MRNNTSVPLICIVDSDRALNEATSSLLRASGFRTAVFESGQAFLDGHQQHEIACLILDIQMPGISGLELQGKLAEMRVFFPIIFVSAAVDKLREIALAQGAVAVLKKPFIDSDLLSAIDAALEVRCLELLFRNRSAPPGAAKRLSTEQEYHRRIVRTLVHIHEHPDDALDLEQVAAVAGFSNFHFHRIFRGMVGLTLPEYVRRLRLQRAARDLKRLDFHVSGYSPPTYESVPLVDVKDLEPMRVISLRNVGPYSQVAATWERLMIWVVLRDVREPNMKMLGLGCDDLDVTPPDQIRYEAAVTVSKSVEPDGEFVVAELAGGSYAVVKHNGPYELLGKTYQRIYGGWLPKSGYHLRDVPSFEQYLNSPENTKPEDLVTLIHVPLSA